MEGGAGELGRKIYPWVCMYLSDRRETSSCDDIDCLGIIPTEEETLLVRPKINQQNQINSHAEAGPLPQLNRICRIEKFTTACWGKSWYLIHKLKSIVHYGNCTSSSDGRLMCSSFQPLLKPAPHQMFFLYSFTITSSDILLATMELSFSILYMKFCRPCRGKKLGKGTTNQKSTKSQTTSKGCLVTRVKGRLETRVQFLGTAQSNTCAKKSCDIKGPLPWQILQMN